MSDFAKIDVTILYADNAQFNPVMASVKSASYSSTPDEFRRDRVDAETGTTTITTSYLTAVDVFYVKNLDTSNNVTVAFQNAAAVAQSQVLGPGKHLLSPDVKASANVTLTATGATCRCEIYYAGT